MESIVLVTIKEWNIENYFLLKANYKHKFNFHLITSKEELTLEKIRDISPKYIFFPHWSWIIEENIYKEFECIVFHMTDLPYGRGGSPLQNLIVEEIYDTKVSAIKVSKELDAGKIYLKDDFNISTGSAEEIFIKLSNLIFLKMIPNLLINNVRPKKQLGAVTKFERRQKEDSNLTSIKTINLNKLYDFIRMLDAEGYPKAYLIIDTLKIEFNEVQLKDKKLLGRFEIKKND